MDEIQPKVQLYFLAIAIIGCTTIGHIFFDKCTVYANTISGCIAIFLRVFDAKHVHKRIGVSIRKGGEQSLRESVYEIGRHNFFLYVNCFSFNFILNSVPFIWKRGCCFNSIILSAIKSSIWFRMCSPIFFVIRRMAKSLG